MHIYGQANNHRPLIHCLKIILQSFCHLPVSNAEGWCCGIFWVIFNIRFVYTNEVRASMRTCGHAPGCKLVREQAQKNHIWLEWLTFSPRKIWTFLFEIFSWFFSIWIQGLQKLIEIFLLTSVGVGVDLLLFLFFTRFLLQLLYSPAHLNQERWNTVEKKDRKK